MDETETPSLIERAAEWLAALDAGTADPQAFAAWRDADPAHAAAFAQVAAAWERMSDARFAGDGRAGSHAPAPPPPVVRRRSLALAASIALMLSVGGLAGSHLWARSTVETAIGERRTVLIGEAARLELNTDSAVAWRAGRDRPQLWLERGQIGIDLPRASPGVLLNAGNAAVRLTPGRYDVRLAGGALSILVLDGRSETAGRSADAGDRLTLAPGRLDVAPASEIERERARAWRRGELVFAGDTLGAAVREYNRYLGRKLVVRDPQVAALQLGGRFTSNDPAEFLSALRATFGVTSVEQGDAVLLAAPRK